MPQNCRRNLGIVTFLFILAAPAQDLSTIDGSSLDKPGRDDLRNLSLLVRQMMPPELSPALRTLNSAINRAFKAEDDTATWRLLTRFIATLQGRSWNEGLELLSSYRMHVDRRLAQPGEALKVALNPLFNLSRSLKQPYVIQVSLVDGRGRAARPAHRAEVAEFKPLEYAFDTKKLRDGEYEVVYELLTGAGAKVAETRRPVTLDRRLDQRLARLGQNLARAPRNAGNARVRAALESAEYLHQVMTRARREYTAAPRLLAHPFAATIAGIEDVSRYAGDPFELKSDLPLAERLVAAALAGRDPFEGLTGDLRLAYRSDVDQSLQPYRVYVPKRPARRLLVTLHGVSGDENTYFGPFTGGLLEKLAVERGFVVASPNGRGPTGGYVGASRKDVYDVRERAVALFGIDDRQVFLTGHSMGAMGAWQIAFEKPELWAAVAPVAGAMTVNRRMLERNPEMPVFLAQGGRDRLTIPSVARNVAAFARETLRTFEYREYPEADHFGIGEASLADIFDFFDKKISGGQ